MNTTSTPYDEVPYESRPVEITHPSRLAALGRLFGARPPDVEACRVLEMGCATGGNLIPMALNFPNSQFVGIDLSSVQIATAAHAAAALQLSNIQFHAMSITDVSADFGQFDYIICHGVYSWVPEFVRQKILAICSENLAPTGLAYVSYNTYPGWRLRGMVRDMMRYHANRFGTPQSRVQQARMLLDFLSHTVENTDSAYAVLLKAELKHAQRSPDFYILHEQLEDINEPVYFHEFVEQATAHNLKYVSDGTLQTPQLNVLPGDVAATLRRIAKSPIEFEQYLDFVHNKTFRRSILTHSALKVQSEVSVEALKELYLWTTAKAKSPQPELRKQDVTETYECENGVIINTKNIMTKAAFEVLAEHPFPLHYAKLRRLSLLKLSRTKSARIPNLEEEESKLCQDLLVCCTRDAVTLFSHTFNAATTTLGSCPKISVYTRFQLTQGKWLTTPFHRTIELNDFGVRLIPLLDGSRNLEQLHAEMLKLAKSGEVPYLVDGAPVYEDAVIDKPVRKAVDDILAGLAVNGLLIQ